MGAVTKSADLAAPAEKVWGVLTDLDTYGQWNAVHVEFPDGTPDLGPDITFKEKVTLMGMPGEVLWKVAEFEDGKRVVLEGEGPMGVKLRTAYDVEKSNGGTKLTVESEFGGEALAAIEAPLQAAAGNAGDESLKKLEALLAS